VADRECYHCGTTFDDDLEGAWDGLDGMVCDYCEHEVTEECGICGERFAECHSGLVVMLMPSGEAQDEDEEPDDGAALRPGVYLVRTWPISTGGLVGMEHVRHGALRRVADVPSVAQAHLSDWRTIGQEVCMGCAAPYVLEEAMPMRRSVYGWEVGGRAFVRRDDAERWRAHWASTKLPHRMEQMLERLRLRWAYGKRPEWSRRGQRRRRSWLKRHSMIYGQEHTCSNCEAA